jgi:hypothetical protein
MKLSEGYFARMHWPVKNRIEKLGLSRKQMEKCFLFVNPLADGEMPLSSQIHKRLFAENREPKTKNILLEAGIVEATKKYSVGRHSTHYRITPGLVTGCITKVPIKDTALCRKLERIDEDHLKETLRHNSQWNQSVTWQRNSVGRLKLTDAGTAIAHELADRENDRTTEQVIAVLEKKKRPRISIKRYGRLYTTFSSCPKDVRCNLLIDDEPVSEIDIRASHPTILLSKCPEDHRFPDWYDALELVKTGMLYKAYESIFEAYVSEEDKSKAEQSEKVWWQVFINRQGQLPYTRKTTFFSVLKRELPSLYGTLATLKRHYPGNMAHYIQGIEANFMHSTCTRLAEIGCPVVSIYDSLIVPKSKTDEALRLFKEECSLLLGVEPAFKIS